MDTIMDKKEELDKKTNGKIEYAGLNVRTI
jgi:hypothetical protein